MSITLIGLSMEFSPVLLPNLRFDDGTNIGMPEGEAIAPNCLARHRIFVRLVDERQKCLVVSFMLGFTAILVRLVRISIKDEIDRPPIVVPPTVLVQRPPEAWGEGR